MGDRLIGTVVFTFALMHAIPSAKAQSAPAAVPQQKPAIAQKLFALANQSRAADGVSQLTWDPTLADAALKHCLRMAVEGSLAHRYDGEPDLTARAGAAGAHFSLIEENIAVGSHAETIHQGWLDSSEHRSNLLNPAVDRVGIAVVANGGVLFAVVDFSRGVDVLTPTQVEERFADLLRLRGLMVSPDTTDARSYCRLSGSYQGSDPPKSLFRWQNGDLTKLPDQVLAQLASGRYRRAAVGSCPPQDVKGAFTVYRVAVLLY